VVAARPPVDRAIGGPRAGLPGGILSGGRDGTQEDESDDRAGHPHRRGNIDVEHEKRAGECTAEHRGDGKTSP
jgi:hypothetical protein